MIIRYLYKYGSRSNIVEYLMNKLYKEHRNDIKQLDFYLPQLCYMCVSKPCESSIHFERFILQISIKY